MRKSCKRGVYLAAMNPVRAAFLGGSIPAAEWATARVRELLALDALAAGIGEPADLAQLRATVEIAAGLSSAGYGPEALPALQAARRVLRAMAGQCAGAIHAGRDDLAQLREALAVADAQRDMGLTRRDHERAAARAMKLIEGRDS